MDALAALRAEISKKRKAIPVSTSADSTAPSQAKRWCSAADIEREKALEYHRREKIAQEKRLQKQKNVAQSSSTTNARLTEHGRVPHESAKKGGNGKGDGQTESERNRKEKTGKAITTVNPSVPKRGDGDPPLRTPEVMRRLRALKQPATLFGEDAWDRFHRLRDLQLALEDHSDGQRNVYQKKMREVRAKHAEEDVYAYTRAKLPALANHTAEKNAAEAAKRRNEDLETTCKEDYVHAAIRKFMRLWYSEIDAISKEERRTKKGRSLLVTYEQTKHWLQPLEKLLRKRKLSKTILDALQDIFDVAAQRDYMQAMSLYLERLAIGNAPWPMGATQVGIHSRAAREKIGEDKIAHVMNDEQTRKYIQAIKRLLTVAQRHFPADASKKFAS